MTGNVQTGRIIPRNYDVFAGLDVDKTSISATFTDHESAIKSIRVPYRAENLLGHVRRSFPGKRVAFAYEAGPTGYGLYDDIVAAGYPCLVVAASMVPTAPGDHVKTNKRDSRKLSESLRGGQLKSIHVPSPKYRELRHLIQLRDTGVRQLTGSKLRIKSLLLFEGIPFPDVGGSWSIRVLLELRRIECSPGVRFKLNQLLDNIEFSQRQVLAATREIRRFCLEDEEISRCIRFAMSIPGIGWITASHLLARIGDWRTMGNVRQVGAFLGLVPKEHSTGDDVERGSITRAGDTRLRNKLIQGAWVAIRIDPELREFYERVHAKHTKAEAAPKAIVAVARKLTMRLHAVLMHQRPYEVRPLKPGPALPPKEADSPAG